MTELSARAHGEPPVYLTSPLLADAGLPHLFTTRHFPGERAPENPAAPFATARRRGAGRAGGLDGEAAAFLRQVHGADVVLAERAGLAGSGDVILGARSGLPLAIFTADCLPIVLVRSAAPGGSRSCTRAGAAPSSPRRARRWRRSSPRAVRRTGSSRRSAPRSGRAATRWTGPVVDRLSGAFPERLARLGEPQGPRRGRDRSAGCSTSGRPTRTSSAPPGSSGARIDNPRALHLVPRSTSSSPIGGARAGPPGDGGGHSGRSRARSAPRARIPDQPSAMLDIQANLERVQEAVARGMRARGRDPADVLLIAVSKTVDLERIRAAVAAGVPALGENRVQEARDKIEALGRPVPWHLIGSLQTNKAQGRGAPLRLDPLGGSPRPGAGARPAGARARPDDRRADPGQRGRRAAEGRRRPGEVKRLLDAVAGLAHLQVRGPHGHSARGGGSPRRRGRTSGSCGSCATRSGCSISRWG